MNKSDFRVIALCLLVALWGPSLAAQSQTTAPPPQKAGGALPPSAKVPAGYVIGVDDVLSIRFWGDDKFSAESVVVRPDGKISLPLIGDVAVTGLTPEQLADAVEQLGTKFFKEPPDVNVNVRDVKSRKVFVIGQVSKPGVYPLNDELNVLQLLATVGGVLEYADKDAIIIIRKENGRERRLRFNYNEVIRGKRLEQNILLQPGDTVLVN